MTRALLNNIVNPFHVPQGVGVRDAAILWHDGALHCFYTASFQGDGTIISHIEHIVSRDLLTWERCPDVIADPPIFWSVGNVIRAQGAWVLCMQDYRIPPGERFAGDDARLWLTRSEDLMTWSSPVSINPGGARVQWTDKPRQIDPFLVEYDGRFWCFYKQRGLGLLVSDDLAHWSEAQPERPAFRTDQTPDGSPAVENACVVRDGEEFVLFYAACREPRRIGCARSRNLLDWSDSRYLDFPTRPWMLGGPNGAMVIDTRADLGVWLMVFHTDEDKKVLHSGVLGLAWSENLLDWECP